MEAIIRGEIARRPAGAIPFRDYMELCLYHDPYGYYRRSRTKVGKDGDFYTSASVGTIMGEMLGRYFVRLADELGFADRLRIAEWGGGTGRMAGHILDAIASAAPSAYDRLDYAMIEISAHHRALQREELARHRAVRHVDADEWLESVPDEPIVVFSHELLDAFPIHRVERRNGRLYEWYVEWDEKAGRFAERLVPIDESGAAMRFLEREGITPCEGQIVDLNPEAAEWITRIGSRMTRGAIVTVDYGDTADELYAPHRMKGTFLCYRNHQAFDDPFAYPGEQDMTAHVDFTACIRAGEAVGLTSRPLRTQQRFLLDEGALGLLAAHDGTDPFGPEARRNRAIRQLLVGDRMGELFKVLTQTKSG
ncbi:SAM-dependent methyltransferase [Paenibacillus flagellatus]|uniref:SAM-dependent methyltransferase n=1 Tax=Paenibacillus flagellatus TaxID=2211139 RepID=A0A2V5K5L8_9BACL|nr:SAM-dependent methyltransferase [Paenibacillus flagellatus]